MELVVELSDGSVVLAEPHDFAHFAVRVGDSAPATADRSTRLAMLLESAGIARTGDGRDVFVSEDAVRRLAADAAARQGRPVDRAWESGFAEMLEFAGRHGWIEDDGAVRAHVEWGV